MGTIAGKKSPPPQVVMQGIMKLAPLKTSKVLSRDAYIADANTLLYDHLEKG